MLADPEIAAVALATPAVTHYKMAKAAMEAGKMFSLKSRSQSM